MKDSKEIYWFRLDCGFYNDSKVQDILFDKGAEGAFVYVATISMLYANGGKLAKDKYRQIAYTCHCKEEVVRAVIEDYGLFVSGDGYFWSERALEEIEYSNRVAEAKSKAGKASAQAKKEQMFNRCSTDVQHVSNKTSTNNNNNYNNNNNININASSKEESLCPTPSEQDSESKPEILSNKNCQQVVDFWNKTVKAKAASLSEVKLLTEKRKAKIRTRWKEFASVGDPVQVCKAIVEKACESKFMQGDNPRGWVASFDWIFETEKNWAKVFEGNYDNRKETHKAQSLDDMYREQIEKMRNKYGTDEGYTDIPEEQ